MKIHLNKFVEQVEPNKNTTIFLKGLVRDLAIPRPYGSENHQKVQTIIENCFYILADEVQNYDGNIYIGDPHTAEVLVGAHYDSVKETMGADDNASAVAVMLAVANNYPNLDKVCYVAFDREEYCGMHHGLDGSKSFVSLIEAENNLKEVHILEMVGYTAEKQQNPLSLLSGIPDKGNFIGLVSHGKANNAVKEIVQLAENTSLPVCGLTISLPLSVVKAFAPHVLRSDHASFWEKQLPAIMWTDTAEFRNPNYHTMDDTPDSLDYDFMTKITELLTLRIRNIC